MTRTNDSKSGGLSVPRRTLFLMWAVSLLGVLAGPISAAPAGHTSPRASVLVVGGTMMQGDTAFADRVVPVLREHYRGCRKVALVLHASHSTIRDRMEKRLGRAFARLGVEAAESLHRHDAAGARRLLAEADGIFVGGGETFVLLAELHRTGQLGLIRERVLAGVPIGGSSAGANVMGLVIGTTNDFPVTEVPSREALGLLPVTINPHHPLPGEPEHGGRVSKIQSYLQFNPSEQVLALANASMVRLHAGRAALVAGTGWIYTAGGGRELKIGEAVPELAR